MRYSLIVVLCGSVFLAACGEPKLDASSEASLKESAAKIRASLAPEEAEQLGKDLMMLSMGGENLFKLALSGQKPEDIVAGNLSKLDGKTAKEISALAAQVRAEMAERSRIAKEEAEARQLQQALQELAELQAKFKAAEAGKAELAAFEVTKARFYKQKRAYSGEEPVIELTVKNGLKSAVARVYFEGKIASPGRSVPWLVKDFNYEVAGGVEPGETANWKLAPNQFSEWGTVEVPADAVFTVEVTRLDGADGKPLFDASAFGEREAARLAALTEKYGK